MTSRTNITYLMITCFIVLTSCSNTVKKNKLYIPESKELNSRDIFFSVTEPSYKDHPLIKELANMETDTLDCSAETFWKIVAKGKPFIPYLIESLTDTTSTNIFDCCKNKNLNIGELSYYALNNIADFPAYAVTKIQFCVMTVNNNCHCWSFDDYLFNDNNKKEFQKKVKDFYKTATFEYKTFDLNNTKECIIDYGIVGHYKLIDYE